MGIEMFVPAIVSAIVAAIGSTIGSVLVLKNNHQWLEKLRTEDKNANSSAHAAIWKRVDEHTETLRELDRRKVDR